MKGSGWRKESHRHKLAGMGIKTTSGETVNSINSNGDLVDHPFFEIFKKNVPHLNEPKYFEEWKKQKFTIVWMPVREYEEAIRIGFYEIQGIHDENIRELRQRLFDENLEYIKNKMLEGQKFTTPILKYTIYEDRTGGSFNQEGHHRAVASEQLGEEIIPVAIIYPPEEYRHLVDEYMSPRIRRELYG